MHEQDEGNLGTEWFSGSMTASVPPPLKVSSRQFSDERAWGGLGYLGRSRGGKWEEVRHSAKVDVEWQQVRHARRFPASVWCASAERGGREECDGGDRQLGYALQSDHCTLTG